MATAASTPSTKSAAKEESFQPFVVSNDVLNDLPALRQRMRESGYLFVKGVGPRQRILDLRRRVLEVISAAGWVKKDADLMEGRWSGAGPFTEGEPEYMDVYKKIINLPEFIAFPEDPQLVALVGKLFDEQVLSHRLRIGRVTFPNNAGQSTGSHQDWHYIHGTPETYTMWMPLGECPIQLGGLAVLSASHKAGFIDHQLDGSKKYAGWGLTEELLPKDPENRWHTADFDLGDVLLFHSFCVHKALPNLTKDRLRLSCDNRYQRQGDAIEEHSMRTHYGL